MGHMKEVFRFLGPALRCETIDGDSGCVVYLNGFCRVFLLKNGISRIRENDTGYARQILSEHCVGNCIINWKSTSTGVEFECRLLARPSLNPCEIVKCEIVKCDVKC
jgi:hypothetical protein